MPTPAWALSITYWLHMLATVVWIGSLAALVLLVLPAAQRTLDHKAFAGLLEAMQRRLEPVAWFCLVVLTGTGLFQMAASRNYQGFLAIDNRWAVAILFKHIVFLLMVAASTYLTWGLMPSLRRNAFMLAQGKDTPEADRLQRQNINLLRLNLILSVIVLALTALARVS